MKDETAINERVEQLFKEFMFDEQATEWVRDRTKTVERMLSRYQCAIYEIETKFNVLNTEFSLDHDRNPINSIHSRLKTFDSIVEKIQRRGLPQTFESIEENLHDIAGVRVVCTFPEDIYHLRNALLKQDDIYLIEEKDYVKNPKPNGYRSLHLIVKVPVFLAAEKHLMKVEIQMRTIAMNFWASLEHQIRYKKDIEFTEEMANELKECAELSATLDKRMDTLRKATIERTAPSI
ncbi:GTP pyrophosphokinase family protein [Stomatohabitans albus]|uniref:GTP pyrophosphokinase n=1 Tax=Stomatohabitans albus TaxID=3110766 RepID=UPI00300D59A9